MTGLNFPPNYYPPRKACASGNRSRRTQVSSTAGQEIKNRHHPFRIPRICLAASLLVVLWTDRPLGQVFQAGAIIRGDSTSRTIALVFTGGDFSEGGDTIRGILKAAGIRGSFFFTGGFYRNPAGSELISKLRRDGHYLGAHSDRHLLYCAWEDRDSLLVSKAEFRSDLQRNYREMERHGIKKDSARYFLPPYEWYNDSIAVWSREMGLTLVNFTPGTLSQADYTTPDMPNYRGSAEIRQSILEYEKTHPGGLNGFLLLTHVGTHPDRQDKFYLHLQELVQLLLNKGYVFKRVDRFFTDGN